PRRGTFGSGHHDSFSHARVPHKGRKSLRRGSLSTGSSSATWTGRLRTLFGLPPARRLTPGRSGGKRKGGRR
ncbi:MAG TPA: hypothetical protein VGS62_11300, partial [Streptosporangiaceae bacterium]|nr:hypothetical protein [Streptosporangiaceae bacterium]